MLAYIIRNFTIFLVATFAFYKLLNIVPKSKLIHYYLIIFSAIVSILAGFAFVSNQSANWIFILISLFILMKSTNNLTAVTTYLTTIFSFSLSFISFTISGIIVSLVLSPIYFQNYDVPWILIRILVGILHFLFISICFSIPRLRKGLNFLYYIPSFNIGSTICMFFITFLLMHAHAQAYTETYILNCMAAVLICGFLLIYWWNYHLTQTYCKFLRKNELGSLNLLLEERNQEIAYLRSENDKLARIIHKDNKIIPALSMAIIDSYKNKPELNSSELTTDSTLYIKLKQLYNERTEVLEKYQQEILHLPQTAFDSVNAVLSYMQSDALKSGIPYQVVLFDNLDSTIPNEIVEDDFTHILSDLLANAINACKGIPSASIQVYLGKMDEIPTIRICNTGNVFSIETLKNLGLSRHSTHADTGGSGIGLMDIWTIKQRYAATLLIDEIIGTDTSSSYTCINILFNHKNHYIIQSNRHKELSTCINRPDIRIIPKEQ